jgi:16S rRNA (cytidine1402-2'-O)-methyltransferase
VGTLYVVAAPAGDPDDLTRRALRILEAVSLIVADDQGSAQALLEHHGIAGTKATALGNDHLEALTEGDVAYLYPGLSPVLPESGYRLVRRALDCKYPVVPVPGPSLPITALVLSGLPADSFAYLGELSQGSVSRRELLATVSLEPRTILALVPRALLPTAISDLHSALGARPLVIVAVSPTAGARVVWRGGLGKNAAGLDQVVAAGAYVLVIGGAPAGIVRWDEEQLRSRIQNLQAAGLGAKAISQQLAGDSGWPRREIYGLAVELVQRGKADAN